MEQNFGSKLRGPEAAGRRGLGDRVGESVPGQVCFNWIGNFFSLTRWLIQKDQKGLLQCFQEEDQLRAAWAPRQTYFQNLHIFGQLSYQLAL